MKLLSLSVEHFRGIRKSQLEFGAGLNVLHGPNEIGKSTLAAAIRAALLLQTSSRESDEFVSWDGGGEPQVELVFESESQRIWRIKKSFGNRPQSFLEESRDGVDFHVIARGRDVDGRLTDILQWGLTPPGGKGRSKGMPASFLSTALLAEQDAIGAIFDHSLSGDSDESGKKRVMEALQAAAEDPLFKSVLQIVQVKVDEAFSSSGQKRRSKDSPWIKLRAQIQVAEEEEQKCREQLQKTMSVEQELQELLARRLDCEAALERSLTLLSQAENDQAETKRHLEILSRLKEDRNRLAGVVGEINRFAHAKQRVAELSQQTDKLAEQEKAAQFELNETASRTETTREQLRAQSAAQTQERQEKRSTLEQSRTELLSAQADNNEAVMRLRQIEAVKGRVSTIKAEADSLSKRVSEQTAHHEEAVKQLRESEKQERELEGVAELIRANLGSSAIEEAQKGLAQTEKLREQARDYRAQATWLEKALKEISLPALEVFASLRELERQIQIAQARVGVGLQLSLRPKQELHISARRDGGEAARAIVKDLAFETGAVGKILLEIEGIAEITITGGEQSARDEVARLQTRWRIEAEPVLKEAGLASLDEILVAIQARERKDAEIQQLLQGANAIDERIKYQQNWDAELVQGKRDFEAAEAKLAGIDRKPLEVLALELRVGDLSTANSLLMKLKASRPKLVERERFLERDVTGARALITEKQKNLNEASEELLVVQAAFPDHTSDRLAHRLTQQSLLSEKLNTVNESLKKLNAELDSDQESARRILEKAENEHRNAAKNHASIANDLRITDSNRASAYGELKVLSEVMAKFDENAARAAVASTEAELAATSKPEREVTQGTLDALRSTVDSYQEELKRFQGAIKEKQGALKHVGGQVAKGRLEDAQDALLLLREKEHDVEIDYEGWALLRETLLEAEQDEGVHLGKVLGPPIMQRFNELTGIHHRGLDLGPDLETTAISIAGETRSLDALSIGTRDQLSIIFRLTLAEQLGSAVVFDDQLTQSDALRMKWIQDAIRKSAANTQIIVFTCRPSDYLDPSELKVPNRNKHSTTSVRSLDLAKIVERL